jgi:dihydrolipoamide dehydrogenase
VYAAGDVNGKWMLAHAAYREAEVAVNQMISHPDRIQYECIPSVIYTTPEVATVGFTDKEAVAKGWDVSTVSIPVAYSGRAVAENIDNDGLYKLVINKKTNTLVGAHLIGSYSSEIIILLASMIQLEIDVRNIVKFVFPHPTVGEIIKDALFKR